MDVQDLRCTCRLTLDNANFHEMHALPSPFSVLLTV